MVLEDELAEMCLAALLTYKIRNMWDHLMRVPRDVANRRNLRALVHQRAKVCSTHDIQLLTATPYVITLDSEVPEAR